MFSADARIDKPAVDSFLGASSRAFVVDGTQKNFAQRLWIATTNLWNDNAAKEIEHQTPPFTRLGPSDLENADVDWEKLAQGKVGAEARLKKKLRPHQQTAVDKAVKHYRKHERGKLIMACGTGKTFTSLKIAEALLLGGAGTVLYLTPSISLLNQTLIEWTAQSENPINAICVCSDETAHKTGDDVPTDQPILPSTTDPSEIRRRIYVGAANAPAPQWQRPTEDGMPTRVVGAGAPSTAAFDPTAAFDHSTTAKNIARASDAGGIVGTFDSSAPAENIDRAADVGGVVGARTSSNVDAGHLLKKIFSRVGGRDRKNFFPSPRHSFNVVFATYQSLDKVAAADIDFDLIICDEAHRTAGFAELGTTAPLFKRVHDQNFIRAKRRLYMTATPKLFTTNLKRTAAEKDLTLWSMDDESVFGKDFYVLKFSDALDQHLLTDYRVLVFTVREEDVPQALRDQFNAGDISKVFGAVNALNKKLSRESEYILRDDPNPMRSAVAYCSSIKLSKTIADLFNKIEPTVNADHVDGSMRSDQRKQKLSALKQSTTDRCNILTNARCLSEGIDVPALDAVLFLSPRKSQVDIIQAVGRVMRTAEGKNYGYVILPVVIPRGADPVDELNHNKDFDVVWQVLNALRAHDDKFYIEVNKLALNNSSNAVGANRKLIIDAPPEYQMTLDFGEYKRAIVARIVEKVGDRQYWATWGRDVAVIAERHKARIKQLIAVDGTHKVAFNNFLDGLRRDINPNVTEDDAVDMLAQHIITRPVFEALFADNNFILKNAVSQSLQTVLNLFNDQSTAVENEKFNDIYKSVRDRCSDIDNAADRQKIIIELYDKFFKVALHKTVEKLGIVYTPVEVVDFILKSVDAVLRAEFDRSLSSEGVHILDPFTGTGTFITRLLDLGLIDDQNLERKYREELHANEIVLLAYYIAAINIENAYRARRPHADYAPFERICLTDTFQLAELDDDEVTNLFHDVLTVNNEHIRRQRRADIRVIVGNPPYSVGQRSANDNAQNQKYPALERRITETYVKHTDASNKSKLYDSYIKAFRWASDRIGESGVIGFVTNGGWLDTASMDGLRKCFEDEFTSIYVFNLRGNARTQGEARRRERDNIFGEGTRTPVTITILVKNPAHYRKAEIHYVDIGDYLDRKAKLKKIAAFDNVLSDRFTSEARLIVPNEKHDWINQRGDEFDGFIPIEPDKKFDGSARSFFTTFSKGINTARDAWAWNFSRDELDRNMRRTINFYNANLGSDPIYDPTKISWVRSTIQHLERGTEIIFDADRIVESIYRPFCRQYLYYDRLINEMSYQMPKLFPTGREKNLMICVPSIGDKKNFSVLITDRIVDLHVVGDEQCFPQRWYDVSGGVFDGVTDHILTEAQKIYGASVSKDDIFYYVYGFLHLPSYRARFANELRKSLPKLILVERAEDFWALVEAGRALADLHIHYETQPAPDGVEVLIDNETVAPIPNSSFLIPNYRIAKMRLSKDRTELKYNGSIIIKNIPARSFEYVVNGRSPLEWIIDRYQIKTDKASGLINDPNDWCSEHGDPDYILRLILSVLTVSLRTVEIIDALPKIDF